MKVSDPSIGEVRSRKGKESLLNGVLGRVAIKKQ
jgi:hypothetical protein